MIAYRRIKISPKCEAFFHFHSACFCRTCTRTPQSWDTLFVKEESFTVSIYIFTCWLTNQILSLKRKTAFQGRQKEKAALLSPPSYTSVAPGEPDGTAGQHYGTTASTLNKWLPSIREHLFIEEVKHWLKACLPWSAGSQFRLWSTTSMFR